MSEEEPGPLTQNERQLLQLYRDSDDEGKTFVISLISALDSGTNVEEALRLCPDHLIDSVRKILTH